MNIDRIVFGFSGFMVCLSLALGYFWTPWWYLLTALVGLNLLQSSFTGFCPLATILRVAKIAPGPVFYCPTPEGKEGSTTSAR
jgi:hypothetical protein